ncbi:NAD-dependent epimerase/dehydratase family protein [Gillisia sp. Hel_I_29]|uniref:NAD-dependent epimerase/dehydratase family protein n=1 Tax=Gillisia sp. Hel_I_29 TaxID=1249975 RepID=UPI00068E3409|nr:SDR family oxidoreductase [Gillisia sp. Hel_I_29]
MDWTTLTPNYSIALKSINALTLKKFGVQIIEHDLTLPNLAISLPKDFDYIFHCAAQPGITTTSKFESYLNNNVIATKNLVGFARQFLNLKLFVNIGTSSVYGKNASFNEEKVTQPISNYGITKLAAEQLVLSNSRAGYFKACSLRLYSVYGSREPPDQLFSKLIKCGLNNETFPLLKIVFYINVVLHM